MKANVVVSGDEAAWITAVPVDVSFGIIAGSAYVVRPYDFATIRMLERNGRRLDKWSRHVFISPAEFGLLGQRKGGR